MFEPCSVHGWGCFTLVKLMETWGKVLRRTFLVVGLFWLLLSSLLCYMVPLGKFHCEVAGSQLTRAVEDKTSGVCEEILGHAF